MRCVKVCCVLKFNLVPTTERIVCIIGEEDPLLSSSITKKKRKRGQRTLYNTHYAHCLLTSSFCISLSFHVRDLFNLISCNSSLKFHLLFFLFRNPVKIFYWNFDVLLLKSSYSNNGSAEFIDSATLKQ